MKASSYLPGFEEHQLKKRVKFERYLENAKLRIEKKLQQLAQGRPVEVALLFEDKPGNKE